MTTPKPPHDHHPHDHHHATGHAHAHAPTRGEGAVPLDPFTFGAEQQCFGCGPNNPRGMRLRFERDGDSVVTRFTPPRGWEGPPGVFHGGLQSTLADEVAGWALVGLLGRMGFTTSLNVRFLRPVRVEVEVEARATVGTRNGNIVALDVKLKQLGRTAMMGTVTFMLPDVEKAGTYLGAPLPESWEHLFTER
jgi:acyl-coenzyme A thioesterase PaaI-like protein